MAADEAEELTRAHMICCMQVKGENKDFNVKRLNKRPMPPRFGRKLSPKQMELASHICLDCGYVYSKQYGHLSMLRAIAVAQAAGCCSCMLACQMRRQQSRGHCHDCGDACVLLCN